jgi:hypothetical protein
MSANQPPPSLDQYPGYFPAAKPPFWTRAKVGAAAGITGLLVGITGSAGGETSSDPEPEKQASAISQADVDEAVESATGDLEQDLEEQADKAGDDLKAAKARLAAYKKKAAAAQRKAVRNAIAAERAKAPAEAPPVQQFVDTPATTTDPQFGTCGEANDNGYGPYRSGVDPEYDWYDDRDDDGVVCES